MRESKTLEYKESITNTFLKTVSAYANYGTGRIVFGIADDGSVVGLSDLKGTCLAIENKINDSIDPVPEYRLDINEKESTITLTVYKGVDKPYFYKSKAYRRNDSSTVPVGRLDLKRLIMDGEGISFEETRAKKQDLQFSILSEKLKEYLKLEDVTTDTLKTLELYSEKDGFNVAAELIADENDYCGIDIARFGENINIILDRETFDRRSILRQYDDAVEMFRKYHAYDQIKGSLRETIMRIPEEAYREAIANALIHRTWDVDAHINVAMFDDKIEITSLGGLPKEMEELDYFKEGISILRNRIIAGIFYRLNMIELFGTGIRRINEKYKDSKVKPRFDVSENSIKIILPVLKKQTGLSEDEDEVYDILSNSELSSSVIAERAGFGKTKTVSILNKLVKEGYVRSSGNGRGKKYTSG